METEGKQPQREAEGDQLHSLMPPRATRALHPHPGSTSGPEELALLTPPPPPHATILGTQEHYESLHLCLGLHLRKSCQHVCPETPVCFLYPSVSTHLLDCLPLGSSGDAACPCLGVRGWSGVVPKRLWAEPHSPQC